MARFVDAIDLPIPPEEAFDFLADFRRTVEWDPGVVEGEKLTEGAPGLGSRFRVVVSILGRRLPLEYEITAFERPHRLILRGGDESLTSIDELHFTPRGSGTRVTYEARLELRGLRSLFDPVLDVVFQLIGRMAARGLRDRFSGVAPGGARPAQTSNREVA